MASSDGFKMFLATTDDRLPLSNYLTVLEGFAQMMADGERYMRQLAEFIQENGLEVPEYDANS